jgi:signal transduction histidine kinase
MVINRQLRYRLQSEAKSLNLAKLQGVLETAGAVCHELNQPMQAVTGYSELLKMNVERQSPQYHKAVAILKQVKRLSSITAKLQTITRYESKAYLDGKIIDIDKASEHRSGVSHRATGERPESHISGSEQKTNGVQNHLSKNCIDPS